MISMCGLAGVWGPAEGSVVSGVWAPAGTSVDSASGRPSDNPSATRSDGLIGLLLVLVGWGRHCIGDRDGGIERARVRQRRTLLVVRRRSRDLPLEGTDEAFSPRILAIG